MGGGVADKFKVLNPEQYPGSTYSLFTRLTMIGITKLNI